LLLLGSTTHALMDALLPTASACILPPYNLV